VNASQPHGATVGKIPLISELGKRRLKIGAILTAAAVIFGTVLGYLYYYQPVRGSGSVSATAIDAGMEINFEFTPTKGISPYRYSWAFDDGTFSASQNPFHTYSTPGTFAPTVTVWDDAGQMTTWRTSVLVNHLPEVVGTASPSVFMHSANASFTAQASEGTPGYTYTWQFGDGNTSFDQNPVHYYTTGRHVATVVVRDAMGMTASWSTDVKVPSPTMNVTVSPSVGYSSLNASFSAQAQGGTPGYAYLWQFGDGTTSEVQNPTHHYSVGNYTVTLVVTDAAGMTASWTGSITVKWPLTVGLTCQLDPYILYTEDFSCSPDQGLAPYTFYWDFGDGQSSTVQNPSHYLVPGSHTITLTVGDSAGETVQKQVAVTVNP
jgi:PKD repeat protein